MAHLVCSKSAKRRREEEQTKGTNMRSGSNMVSPVVVVYQCSISNVMYYVHWGYLSTFCFSSPI